MKKILFAILLLISVDGFSQTSFKMQVDTAFHVINDYPTGQIISCADGGIAISGRTWYASILLKFDSSGNLQWNKIGCFANDFTYSGLQLFATSDSGFYMKTEDEPDMFGWFGWPIIQKFDKNGNVFHTARTYVNNNPGMLQGNNIFITAVEKYNDNLHGYGFANFYDSVNDVPCCGVGYSFKFDSTLSLSSKFGTEFLFYNSYDVPYCGINVSNTDSQFFAYSKYDTSGLKIGSNYFLYDTTEMHVLKTLAVCQDSRNIYSLYSIQIGGNERFGIHKTDLNWSSNYFMVIDSTSVLPTMYNRLRNIDMNKSEMGNVLISGIAYNSNYSSLLPLMIEIDTIGAINYSWQGDGSDSIFSDSFIDTTSQSALFLSTKLVGQYQYAYQFEKEYFSSPTCGFIPLNLSPYFISINDSVVIDTIQPIVPLEPHVDNTLVPSQPFTIGPSTAICGILSGVNDIDDEHCAIEAFPNPANEFINLSLNCDVSMYSSIVIINLLGSEIPVSDLGISDRQVMINTKEMSNGIYSVLLRLKDGTTSSRKIIVQH